MYVPKQYQLNELASQQDLIESIRMGTVVSADSTLAASPLPFTLTRTEGPLGTLYSHMDKRNPLWHQLQKSKEALIIFWGPNCYISPSWYHRQPRVPTWYYGTVHVRGEVTINEDPQQVLSQLAQLTQQLEPAASSWELSDALPYAKKLLPAIVGMSVTISAIDAQVRVGQENNKENKSLVYQSLKKGNLAEQQMASFMQLHNKK